MRIILLACTDLGYANSFRNHANYMYEELNGHGPCRGHLPSYRSSDEALYSKCRGNYDQAFVYILPVSAVSECCKEMSAFMNFSKRLSLRSLHLSTINAYVKTSEDCIPHKRCIFHYFQE